MTQSIQNSGQRRSEVSSKYQKLYLFILLTRIESLQFGWQVFGIFVLPSKSSSVVVLSILLIQVFSGSTFLSSYLNFVCFFVHLVFLSLIYRLVFSCPLHHTVPLKINIFLCFPFFFNFWFLSQSSLSYFFDPFALVWNIFQIKVGLNLFFSEVGNPT